MRRGRGPSEALTARERAGVALAARYAAVTNRLGYCGAPGAFGALERAARGEKGGAAAARAWLATFEGLCPYLEVIAQAAGLPVFDEEVVDAYWHGNRLLEAVSRGDVARLVRERLAGPGRLPAALAEEKAASLPEPALPCHAFHVLHINFLNPRLEAVRENLAHCLPAWARVLENEGETLQVTGPRLVWAGGEMALEERRRRVRAGFAGEAGEGAWVSVHWETAACVLTRGTRKRLQRYTEKTLSAVNARKKRCFRETG